MGPQSPDPRSHGRPGVRRRLARQRPCPLRRAEAPRGAGQAADRGPRRHHARRAHQPPRRRRRRVAVPAPEDPLAGQPGRLPRGHPRPLVPRRSLHQDLGNPRRHHGPVRRRLRGVRAGPRRTRPLRVRDGKQAPAAREEGARLAPPRRPGPHRQAQVPDRGGQRPDRRRPRAARLDGPEQDGHRPARQGRPGPGERLPRLPRRRTRAEALRQHHPAACARRAAGPRGRQRRRQDHPAEAPQRRDPAQLREGQARQDGGHRGPHPGGQGTRRRLGPARDRSDRARKALLQRRRQGIHRRPARGAAWLHQREAVDPGQGPLRWRTPAPAAPAPARGGAQRADAR